MSVKKDLLKKIVADEICRQIGDVCIDESQVVNTEALEILEEIRRVIVADGEDYDIVEDIVTILLRHNIDTGSCHDFG